MAAKVSREEISRRGQAIDNRLRAPLETEDNIGRMAQGSSEWEQRLWSLGKDFRGPALSLEATSREVIYEDV